MKKILAICLSVLLICAAMPFAFATAADEPTIVVSHVEGQAGDTVSVTVSLKNNPGILSAKVKVGYDATALELIEAIDGDFAAKGYSYSEIDVNPFVINWCLTTLKDNDTSELLATLVFKIKDDAAVGTYPLTLTYSCEDDFYNHPDWDVVDFAASEGSVTVICAEHTYDAECDPACNDCGYIRPVHTEGIVHFDAVAPGCHYNGNIEYWYCPKCEGFWADEALTQLTNSKNVILPAVGSENLQHVAAVEPSCDSLGNIEYWFCPDCEQYWQDEALTQLTNSHNVILGTADHTIVHFDAVAPGCHYNGNIEYWFCTECEGYWQDAALTQLTNSKNIIVPAKGGDVVAFEAIEPGCHYNGRIAYWFCPECEQVWQDEALTQLTNLKNVILPAVGSDNLQHVAAVEPTCQSEGNIEHWFCPDCEQYWQDAALTQLTNSKNVKIGVIDHNIVHFDAVDSGCHYIGNIEYWFCTECEGYWQDAALTQLTNSKNIIVPAKGGDVVAFEAIAPGCHYNGQIAYWFCPECEQFWQDEALTQITNSKNVILPAIGGDVEHVNAKAPTCFEPGNIEYWFCAECEQFWQDEALTQLTNSKNVILAPADHNIVNIEAVQPGCHYIGNIEYWYCTECETFWQNEALTQITNSKNVILPALKDSADYVAAKAPTCSAEGNVEYWFCAECEQVWVNEALTQLSNLKNVIIGKLDHTYDYPCDPDCNVCGENREISKHNMAHKDAVAPSCTENGNIEYWYCVDCGMAWLDEACTLNTNLKAVVLGRTCATNAVHNEGVEAGCHYTGVVENWYCANCDVYYLDAACTVITNYLSTIIPAKGGDVVAFEAIAPGCHYNGRIAYWFCPECEQVWQDEALTQLTNLKNVILPATGSENLQHVEAKDPTCLDAGNIEYWYCPDCEQYWQDAALTQITNAKNVLIAPIDHTIVHFDAVEAGCHYIGNIEYWYCSACEMFWQDEALTQITNSKNVIVPAKGGDVIAFEAIEPGCHYNGRIAYWYCAECDQFWQDEALTQLTNSKNVILPATGSENLKHVEYKAPTATENGNVEYWFCPDCEQFWTDEALTQLTNSKNVIIPATGAEEPDSPVTGDTIVPVVIALLTLIASGVAVSVLKNKKHA